MVTELDLSAVFVMLVPFGEFFKQILLAVWLIVQKKQKLRERHRCFALMSDPADSCCQLTSSGGEPWTIPEASRDINTLSQEEHKVYILKFWD